MRNTNCEAAAQRAANNVRERLGIHSDNEPRVGLVLGSKCGEGLPFKDPKEVRLQDIVGFEYLMKDDGGGLRTSRYVYGTLEGVPTIALVDRVHMNEDLGNSAIKKLVRLQTDVLCRLRIQNLILLGVVGSLHLSEFSVGDIAVINGLMSFYGPDLPRWRGDSRTPPEDALDAGLRAIALEEGVGLKKTEDGKEVDRRVERAKHVMVKGPAYEGRETDKPFLTKNTAASVVGMNFLPETSIAALYEGLKVLALGFVTNDAREACTRESNMERVHGSKDALNALILRIIRRIARR